MFESLFEFPSVIQKQQSAPLLREREQFLCHVSQRGCSQTSVRQYAKTLLYVIRFLHLTNRLRAVNVDEINGAARAWLKSGKREIAPTRPEALIRLFSYTAKQFLRFHNKLVRSRPNHPFADKLDRFGKFVALERGLSPSTHKAYCWHASQFLKWYATLGKPISQASLADTDNYLLHKSQVWNASTLVEAGNVLRCFFRYSRMTRWCRRVNADAIKANHPREPRSVPGPDWQDVRRLLRFKEQDTRASMRARVLILLYALYGLRTSEATSLLLRNVDWKTRIFTIRRAKNYKLQSFPIVRSLELALKKYLKLGRPNCESEFVIVTLHPPYRPVHVGCVAQIINKRMKLLGIKSAYGGPRALRHACATRLLNEEMSLQQIADFLGHEDCMTVGVYAKHDLNSLKAVAGVDLCSGLRHFPKPSLVAWNRPDSAYMYLPPASSYRAFRSSTRQISSTARKFGSCCTEKTLTL